MIAITTSLLFGFAASMALVVLWLSVRSGVALSMILLANPELARGHTRQNAPASPYRVVILPVEQDRTMRVPRARTKRVGA